GGDSMSFHNSARVAALAAVLALAFAAPAFADAMPHPEAQQHAAPPPKAKGKHPAALMAMPPGAVTGCNGPHQPFCDAMMAPTPGWTGNVFKLSQDYPSAAPQDQQPWLKLDAETQPLEHLKAVLAYFYDGNIRDDVEKSFDPAL